MPAEAVLAALQAVLKAIAPLKLPVALLGGLALAVWKHPRFTKDVDVLLALGQTPRDQLVQALRAAGIDPKRGDGVVRLGKLELLQLVYDPPGALVDVQVDILLATDQYQLQALARRVSTTISSFDSPVEVLSCEDVILHKLMAGRMIDLADAASLFRVNRKSLDFTYLLRWIDKNALHAEFSQVWREAFPGEELPRLER